MEAAYPVWPCGKSYATREAGTLAAVAESDPGDSVIVHRAGCAVQFDAVCDCGPQVIVVTEGRA